MDISHWLLKAEPLPHIVGGRDVGSFPFSRLVEEGTSVFNGVRNYSARNALRDKLMPGHLVFYYHSSVKDPGIAGIAEVVRRGYPDPQAADPSHPFYDTKHTDASPRWFSIDIRAVRPLQRFVPLSELRQYSTGPLSSMTLFRQSRLSVQPVTDAEWEFILGLASGEPVSLQSTSQIKRGSAVAVTVSAAAPAKVASKRAATKPTMETSKRKRT